MMVGWIGNEIWMKKKVCVCERKKEYGGVFEGKREKERE